MIPHVRLHGRSWNGYITIKGARSVGLGRRLQMARSLMSWSLLLVYQLKFFFRVTTPFFISIWLNDKLENLVAAN